MSTLTIENIFCYEQAQVEIPPGATLITGRHSSGKTSLARVLGCLATHQSNPAGLSAASAKAYVRDGAVEGFAELEGVSWAPPAGIAAPPGAKPTAPPHAVGLIDFLSGRGKDDRAKLWEGMFLPSDPAAILKPHWPKDAETQLMSVVQAINKQGWDSAQKIYTGQRLAARRRWEEITGDRYGSKKAAEWRPKAWHPDLEGMSEDDVRTAVTEAQDALRALSAQQAVSQDRIDKGIQARDVLIPNLQSEIDKLEKEIAPLREELRELDKKHNAAQNLDRQAESTKRNAHREATSLRQRIDTEKEREGLPCAYCGEPLEIRQNATLAKFERRDVGELKEKLEALRKPYADAAKAHEEAVAATAAIRDMAQKRLGQQRVLRDKLNQLRGQLRIHETTAKDADLQVHEGADAAERSHLERQRDEAQLRYDAWRQERDARRAHESYVELDVTVKLLAPTGARGQFMEKYMAAVRKVLANITKATGWKPIRISKLYEVTSGGRPAALTAANEQAKCQWALQIACACLWRGCRWLVLDATDLLRDDSWTGLVKLVDTLRVNPNRKELHIVVCATSTEAPEGWHSVNLDDIG